MLVPNNFTLLINNVSLKYTYLKVYLVYTESFLINFVKLLYPYDFSFTLILLK